MTRKSELAEALRTYDLQKGASFGGHGAALIADHPSIAALRAFFDALPDRADDELNPHEVHAVMGFIFASPLPLDHISDAVFSPLKEAVFSEMEEGQWGGYREEVLSCFTSLPESLQTTGNFNLLWNEIEFSSLVTDFNQLPEGLRSQPNFARFFERSNSMVRNFTLRATGYFLGLPEALQSQDNFDRFLDCPRTLDDIKGFCRLLGSDLLNQDNLNRLFGCTPESISAMGFLWQALSEDLHNQLSLNRLFDSADKASGLSDAWRCLPRGFKTQENLEKLLSYTGKIEDIFLEVGFITPHEKSDQGVSKMAEALSSSLSAEEYAHQLNAAIIDNLAADSRARYRCDVDYFLLGSIFSGQMLGWGVDKGFYDLERARACLREVSDGLPFSIAASVILLDVELALDDGQSPDVFANQISAAKKAGERGETFLGNLGLFGGTRNRLVEQRGHNAFIQHEHDKMSGLVVYTP